MQFSQELKKDLETIAQGKSDFVLEHLIVGQEDTLPMQWVQCILELQARYFSISNLQLDIEDAKQKHKQHRFLEAVTFGLFGNVRRQELRVENLELSIKGLLGEFNKLYKLYKSMPRFTREQIEESQYEYWKTRLTKQGYFDYLATGRVQQGNLEGLRQISTQISYGENGEISFNHLPLLNIKERFEIGKIGKLSSEEMEKLESK